MEIQVAIERDKSIKIQDVKDKLNEKVNTSDALTFTDIISGGNLSGKVTSADAINTLNTNLQSNFLRGICMWIPSNETQRFRVNTPGSFVFTSYGTSVSQWALYYINNQPPGYAHKILGEGSSPTVTFNNTELVISNNVGWTTNYFLIREFTRLQ